MTDRPGIPGCAQWVEGHLDRELTPFQVKAALVLCRAFGSPWNSPWNWSNVNWEFGRGISVCAYTTPSTYDSDDLTRLVIAAHDECVRVEILPATPRMLRIAIHPRERDGGMGRRHPTIEDAIARFRGVPAAVPNAQIAGEAA